MKKKSSEIYPPLQKARGSKLTKRREKNRQKILNFLDTFFINHLPNGALSPSIVLPKPVKPTKIVIKKKNNSRNLGKM